MSVHDHERKSQQNIHSTIYRVPVWMFSRGLTTCLFIAPLAAVMGSLKIPDSCLAAGIADP